MASHALPSGRKCLHVIGGEDDREGNQRDQRERYHCSHCVSWRRTARHGNWTSSAARRIRVRSLPSALYAFTPPFAFRLEIY